MNLAPRFLLVLGLGTTLAAQAPAGWNAPAPLGQGVLPERDGAWGGFGLWSADQHGPAATFDDSLGLGNGLTGHGFHLEGGVSSAHWDLAAEVMGGKTPQGASLLTLYRGHLTYRSQPENGWDLGLEREPLVWGYGLNGGYLLGSAARPFPKARVESPMTPLHLWRVPLGTWGWQAFMGKLESSSGISSSLVNPLQTQTRINNLGTPLAPFLNGYRIQAAFGENMEYYLNYINLWGGTLNGVPMDQGYGAGDYLTAMLGLKDTLAEANVPSGNPDTAVTPYRNKAISAGNFDTGFRLRLRGLEAALGASMVHAYLSRGSKNIWWTPGTFLGNPIRYLADDVKADAIRLGKGQFTATWNAGARVAMPNLASPNDTVGLLFAWPALRLGLEYQDTCDLANQWYPRSFTHLIYLSGFYTYGDPLGEAVGGEARTTTARLEATLNPHLNATTILQVGMRPFRDEVSLWEAANPGLSPVPDRFLGIQQTVQWKITPHTALDLGVSWQHHNAVGNVADHEANAFRYYADLTFRWPRLAP